VAGQWDDVREDLFGSRIDLEIALALVEPGLSVGDLGCGTGRLSELLAPHVARVVSVDASAEMLESARGRLSSFRNVDLHQSDLEHLPVGTATLDLALLSLVLAYVAEPGRVLAEAHRALKPGGRVVVMDMMPHDREDLRHAMGHVWGGFADQQISGWLSEAGFSGVTLRRLAGDAQARGPGLFIAQGRK
jgi:ArsR family transcriptional regulator